MLQWFAELTRALARFPLLQGLVAASSTFILEDPTTVGRGLLVADGKTAFSTALIRFAVVVSPRFSCGEPVGPFFPVPNRVEDFALPKLFKIYLRLGAKVLSEPALDRDFGTIDSPVMLDAQGVGLSSLRVVV